MNGRTWRQRSFVHSWSRAIIVLLFTELYVVGDMYETIYWSPQNLKFAHSKEHFKSGKAYYEISVMPMSYFNVLCPNLVQVEQHLKNIPSKDNLFENLWLVDKEDFINCDVDTRKRSSRLLYQCNPTKALELQYYQLKFLRQSATSGQNIEIEEGKSYYFVATSDGTKESLNSTAGGHCNDTAKGISMRLCVYVCFTNFTDPRCQQKILNDGAKEYDVKKEGLNGTGMVAKSERESSQDTWQVLAIAFAVAFAVSFLVNSIFLVVVCSLRNSRSSCKDNSNVDEEPLKSISGVEGKKPPKSHVRISAAL